MGLPLVAYLVAYLVAARPQLVDLPQVAGDALEPARCGGDLVPQACADDPQAAVQG